MAKIVTPLQARTKFRDRLLFGLFFKPIRMFCEHCDKFVPSDITWTCGYCDSENRQTKIYSILNKCQRCKRAPKAFLCPHCNEVLFLDTEKESSRPARKIGYQSALTNTEEGVAEETHQAKMRDLERKKFEIEREIQLARLNAELDAVKKLTVSMPAKSLEQQLEEDCRQHQSKALSIQTIVRREKKLNEEHYKNDPELLEKANHSLDWWEEQQSLKS